MSLKVKIMTLALAAGIAGTALAAPHDYRRDPEPNRHREYVERHALYHRAFLRDQAWLLRVWGPNDPRYRVWLLEARRAHREWHEHNPHEQDDCMRKGW